MVMRALFVIGILGGAVFGCGNEAPAPPERLAEAPLRIDFDTVLEELKGRRVVVTGFILDRVMKGYPLLWENAEKKRSILLGAGSLEIEKWLSQRVEVVGIVVDLEKPPPKNGTPYQGLGKGSWAIQVESVREVR